MKTQQSSAGTRQRLLEAARCLFREKGYNATGMAEILRRARANAGSFYHFYASKEELLLAVLESDLEELGPTVVQPALARQTDPIEPIFVMLESYRERLVATDCTYGCPMGKLALEIDPGNLPAHRLLSQSFDSWKGAIRECLEAARSRFPRGTDLEGLATLILSAMEGGVMQSRSKRAIAPYDLCVAQLRSYFGYLLAAGKARRK